jgi:hypothetical protein
MAPGMASIADPLWVAGIACLAVLASAFWAHFRFAGYDRLPRQFGFTLKPTSYAPGWVMIWLFPALLVGVLGAIALLVVLIPREQINGDPAGGLIIASIVTISVQVLTLWLLTRWANGPST